MSIDNPLAPSWVGEAIFMAFIIILLMSGTWYFLRHPHNEYVIQGDDVQKCIQHCLKK